MCALGLSQDTLRNLFGAADAPSWRGESLEMGRATYDSKHCAVWRALFESVAPLGRFHAP